MRYLAPLLYLATACQTHNQSTLKHDLEKPVWFGPFDYLELSHDDYVRSTRGPFYEPDSTVHRYLQGWVDHIDQRLRALFPKQLAGVPRPRSAVRKTPEVGAFTMGSKNVCYSLPVRINASLDVAEGNMLKAVSPRRGQLAPDGGLFCQVVPVKDEDFAEFARWYSARFAPCSLVYKPELSRNDQLQMNGPCVREDFFPKKSMTELVRVKVAPNRILLFSGTISLVENEPELMAIIAHELTHYYRAHVVHDELYNHCYELRAENESRRPKPEASLDDICDKLRPRINFSPPEAAKRKMGYYTIEQEADEMALEILALVGIDPEVSIAAWYKLAAVRETGKFEFDIEHCKKLEQNGWRDSSGREVFVPVGDYRSAHQSWCFRIHNLHKELAAHRYRIGEYQRPKVAEWSAIRNEVSQPQGQSL